MESVLERYNGCLTRAAAHFTEYGKSITREGLRQKCKRMGVQYNTEPKNYPYLEKMKRIADEFPSYDTFERIEGDVLIVSDLHCPFFSPGLVCRAPRVAKAQGIRQ
jgi:hypothetical protein